jgi:hypothetical protein
MWAVSFTLPPSFLHRKNSSSISNNCCGYGDEKKVHHNFIIKLLCWTLPIASGIFEINDISEVGSVSVTIYEKETFLSWACYTDVGFEVVTAVVMKCSIFWNITPYSPLKANQHFGEKYSLHLQSWINLTRKKAEAGSKQNCSALKIEVTYSSETSVEFQRATRW